MLPRLSRKPFAVAPVHTTVFTLALDKTDRRVECIITELRIPCDIAEDIEGINLVGLFGVNDGLEVVAQFLLAVILALVQVFLGEDD
jgi:hypothetical protein